REFAESVVPLVIYPEVLSELRRHQKAGRLTILNSASPGIYVAEIAKVLGFDHWIATRLVWYETMPFLPEIDGPNNKHEAKISAMSHLLPQGFDSASGERLPDSWGYSDSSADVPMLSLCQHAMMIHPSPRFAAIGEQRQWWTLLPPRPYAGKWLGRLQSILQAFGLFRVRQLAAPSVDGESGTE
ncbi:MAG: haloacid dehalogenase-like hydrolase, partial [Verrucomicrobiae bacterium]|nr:haloacid dehalogenase-like hydrolase [Verrucomicrobiae bacterium]